MVVLQRRVSDFGIFKNLKDDMSADLVAAEKEEMEQKKVHLTKT